MSALILSDLSNETNKDLGCKRASERAINVGPYSLSRYNGLGKFLQSSDIIYLCPVDEELVQSGNWTCFTCSKFAVAPIYSNIVLDRVTQGIGIGRIGEPQVSQAQ